LGVHWPQKLKTLGYYKAEEYQLFVMQCLPYILNHLNLGRSAMLGALGVLLIEVSWLFHSHSQQYGWSKEAMGVAQNLLVVYRMWVEENLGPNSSPLKHVASVYTLGSLSFIFCGKWGKCDNFQLFFISIMCLVSSSWYQPLVL